MTGQEVYLNALALYDELESDGTIDDDTDDSYSGKVIRLINLLQRELAKLEGVEPVNISSLSSELSISDDTAERILPYGLAALFALADKDMEMFATYNAEYRSLKRTIPAIEEPMTDDINVLSGLR